MYKEKLILIFSYLPSRLKIIAFAFYKALELKDDYNSPDHFPLNYQKKLDLPIFGSSAKIGFFYRQYQEKKQEYTGIIEDLFKHKYEIIYGVIKWIGFSTNDRSKMAGIELEEEISGGTNGWHEGTQLFACPDRKAVFVPLTHLMPDKR
jgi:hypothetical protein